MLGIGRFRLRESGVGIDDITLTSNQVCNLIADCPSKDRIHALSLGITVDLRSLTAKKLPISLVGLKKFELIL